MLITLHVSNAKADRPFLKTPLARAITVYALHVVQLRNTLQLIKHAILVIFIKTVLHLTVSVALPKEFAPVAFLALF